jgi:hypothetical protein
VDALGGGAVAVAVRKDPAIGAALERCAYMLDLIEQVQAAQDLRWERGIGVPPAFGMQHIRLRAIPM